MKLRNLFMAVMAGAALLVGCNKEVDQGPASLDVKTSELNLTSAETTEVVTFVATRDWVVSGIPDWMNASDESGVASDKEQSITLYVDENTGYDRKASIVITIGFARSVISVNQAGPEGEKGEGTGTLEDPYTVAGAVAYVRELGADVESPQKVFVKGVISNVETTFEASGTYGNATFDLVDEGNASLTFKAFQTYYLGNVKWTAGENNPDVKAGDEVILYGTIYNYRGNTPETTGKGTSFIYSLNGVDRGGIEGGQQGSEGEAKGDGTLENPYNPAGASALAASLADNATSESSVYIKGKISRIAQSKGVDQTFEGSGDYGNASFYIVDAEDGTGEFYIYQTYYLGGVKWVAGNEDVKVGDEVIIYGPVTKYVSSYGTTLETAGKGASHIYSLNGKTEEGGTTPGGDTPITHDGLTPETAFTASEAHAWVLANITGNNNTGDTKYYVTGTIQRFYQKEGADQNFTNNSYKQASFFITDDGNASENEFEAYQINYLNGDTFADGNTDVKVGDVVMVYGPLARYNEVTETAGKGAAYLYSLNGTGGGDNPGGDNPGGDTNIGVMDSNVTFGTGTSGYTDNTVNVTYNGTKYSNVANVKMGTSKVYGNGTVTIPAGTTVLNFFSVGWKGADASVKFTIDGKEYTQDVKANEGATGSGPYEITVADTDKYTIQLPQALAAETQAKVETYAGTNSGFRAFIFGVHALTGEGSGDNPGGNDQPGTNLPVNDGLTEETAFTVEDAVYVAKNGTEDKEYFVKAVVGKDINIKNGVATFELMDGTTNDKLTVIKAKSFGGAAFEGTEPMEWMDEVILKGKVGTTNALPTLTAGTLVKWNGKTSFTETPATGHDGLTLETAFTASEANAWIMEKFTSNGNTGNDKYYVKGKIVRMYQNNGKDQNFTNNSYKQATFFITDDGNSGTEFEAYQINYLGGAAFAEGNTDVKVGDEVVIYGPLARYNTTAETNGKGTAYLYSLNGETQPKSNHDGLTLENAFTASEANSWIMANISGNTNTGNTKYYVKGKISRMYQSNGKDQNFTNNSYKQASFFITDDGNSGTEFEAYQINYLGGAAFAEGNTDVKVGDEVVIYGPLAKYNTIAETAGKGAAYLYSLNGKTTDEGSNPGGGGGTTSNDPVTITFAEQNLDNAQEITSLTVGAITITGDKGSNSNAPKYYTTGTAVRFYGGNSFTLTSSGNKIAKVEFTFASGEGTNEITADVGTFQSTVWTGSAQAVKFTIGGTSGQRRISKIVVEFE